MEPRKRAKAQLAIGVLMVAIGATILFFNWRWTRSALAGPVPITLAELRRLDDPKSLANPWVSFTCDEVIETGLGISSTKSGQTTEKTRFLLVRELAR